MGVKDAKTDSRGKEEKPKFDHISRSSSTPRREITCLGVEQERVCGEGGTRSSTIQPRTGVTGKMLDHLITEYLDQVAAKQNEIAGLEARIKNLRLLKDELEKEDYQ